MKIITFFNCRGKIGKTTMIYHLAHKFAEKGVKVLAVDLDPQAGLTEMFGRNNEVDLEVCSENHSSIGKYLFNIGLQNSVLEYEEKLTVYQINQNLKFIPSDIYLSICDNDLSDVWGKQPYDDLSNIARVLGPYNIINKIANDSDSQIVIIDSSSNSLSLNKSIFISSDFIILPVGFEEQGCDSIYATGILVNNFISNSLFGLKEFIPSANRQTYLSGYIVLQSDNIDMGIRQREYIIESIPKYYSKYIIGKPQLVSKDMFNDECSLSILKFNPSLYQMSREAGKPMFHLTPADGAIGNHLNAVRQCSLEYDILVERINEACKLGLKL